ncbi:hypothetical protein [Cellulosimicrobium protaetiae]|uniref:Uncharacterized protein n=1 Tax=Cellulosimicrobium protaetiae TaxID=2587808 RepID=A0A6M5U8G2_9MICO|nr:hypothetical protein [Cellulosimicrobium protaetiae]QJW34816.1 hypothetical protein FIC82_012795 [Cellulosimicrobium protaetiae]
MTSTTSRTSGTSGTTTAAPGADQAARASDDVRDVVGVSVLLPDGRLAGRSFASRAEAEAWARPDEGERVVELNLLCDCDL